MFRELQRSCVMRDTRVMFERHGVTDELRDADQERLSKAFVSREQVAIGVGACSLFFSSHTWEI